MSELSPADIAALLAKLGLDPATTDVAALLAKIDALIAAEGQLTTTAAQAGDSATQLANANAELEKVRGEYATLFEREQAAGKAKSEAEADAVLEQYADCFKNDEAKAKMRALLLSDRETAVTILEGIKERAAAQPEAKPGDAPPAPQHDPAAKPETGADDGEELAAKVRARAEELRTANPKLTRAEALSKAERELRAAA